MKSFDKYIYPLAVVTAVVWMLTLGLIFFYAPVETTMGVVQKIFYVHVPSALAAYAGFTITSLCSMGYLLKPGNPWLPVAARTGADPQAVAAYNGLPAGYAPRAGDEIVLPPKIGGYAREAPRAAPSAR